MLEKISKLKPTSRIKIPIGISFCWSDFSDIFGFFKVHLLFHFFSPK